MKAFEFPSTLNPDGTLKVPEGIAVNLPQGAPLRVLVLVQDGDDEESWENLAALDFGQGYADSDAIYDQLSSR